MNVRPLLVVLLSLPTTAVAQPVVTLRPGLVITRSVRIAPRVYTLPATRSLDSALIIVRGDDVTVDFAGATLRGTALSADPDAAEGIAVRIDGGRNVTIRNATIRGYKIAVLARGTRNLRLIDNDLSSNWKPRLYSLVEHESLADWLSHHKNEKDEWMRFGAGAYLSDVKGGEIRGTRIVQGMEGIMLVRSDSLRIVGNTIAFNSGVGIGLYRSNDNVIMHNRVDFNVRGYSHGFFRRGQDSADLLIYEQSSRNVVAYNSMTHGGDGLFLWAGQQTMDTGDGGANDNLFYENDFSFAPTNGMEATFSRNTFARNRIEGSDHGLWGGYSFESRVLDNDFVRNRIGIAIEHGQNNVISGNVFDHDGTGIQLWANAIEPSDWQYPKKRDTRSMRYGIMRNTLVGTKVGVRMSDTRAATLRNNVIVASDSALVMKDTAMVAVVSTFLPVAPQPGTSWPRPHTGSDAERLAPSPDANVPSAFGDPFARRDRSAIIITEWGPYDWNQPLLWPADSSRRVPLPLRVLGPAGTWRVVGKRGIAQMSLERGRVGDTIVVTPRDATDWELQLQHRGAGKPVRFAYRYFEPRMDWDARFFVWSDSTDPRTKPDEFARLLTTTPVLVQRAARLDYMWYRPTVKGLPQTKFALSATTRVHLPPGVFTLRTISDDAVRVWVDDTLLIDAWTPHESLVSTAPITAGAHVLRVMYYQVDGWTELRLDILRGRQRAGGSPGPH